ncbi:MAG TPA: NB-ARC domain-containing protein [Roseiflexaceae bacterium]|nr:NB-ARC domain-containing protein [Roseiflexaceae bacterium]
MGEDSGQQYHNSASNQGMQGSAYGDVTINNQAVPPSAPGSAPPLPPLLVGRDEALADLRARLGVDGTRRATVITAVRGWPGVGKTTLAAALAHDPAVKHAFPDGVLWASLGETPGVFAELGAWSRALGVPDLAGAKSVEELTAQLTALLRNKRMLLIVDDVWRAADAAPFRVAGPGCALIFTTRLPDIAREIAPVAGDVYVLGVLKEDDALELLRVLAPGVVAGNTDACRELARELEGLPLALQVAGRLLHAEAGYGFGVDMLLDELRSGALLLQAQAPADRIDQKTGTTPTVAVLLQKSTDRLDAHTRDCFAILGVFAPKPATFDADAMGYMWEVDDPKPAIRTLSDRGLLEPTGTGRFWMHAILVAHAKTFLTEDQ